MKKRLLLIAMLALAFVAPMQAQRYLSEIFTSRTLHADVIYGVNVSVLSGQPAPDTLKMDIYTPMNDTMQQRPVIFVAHTGSFLPYPINGGCTGSKSDYTVTQFCDRMAARGFVTVAIEYRLGWNPISTDQNVRTGTLLNAAYRGIQDIRTAARFLRADAAANNTYKINPNKFVAGGFGTGGYIALGAGFLDSFDEINLPKFINTQTLTSYVDTSLSGDPYGTWNRPLNVANHVGQSSDFQMVWNAGGAIGDSTWIEAGEPPVVSTQVPSDPFAPYDYGAVIVPTTMQFVVNVSGAKGIIRRADALGLNANVNAGWYGDAISQAQLAASGGIDGLFPLTRPGVESGPWEFWDTTTCPNNANSLATNPDMSLAKANAYLDSITDFVARRVVCGIGLAGCNNVSTPEPLDPGAVHIYPNPSSQLVNIRSQVSGSFIHEVNVMDLSGRVVKSVSGLKSVEYSLTHDDLTPGMYLLKVKTSKGLLTHKVIFN